MHVNVTGTFCLGVISCFNLSIQGFQINAYQTGGISTGGGGIPQPVQETDGEGKTHYFSDFTGVSVDYVTATPNQEGQQIVSFSGAEGPIGANFAVGRRTHDPNTSGGLYYEYGWSGGTGYAVQGPPLWDLQMNIFGGPFLQWSLLD
jgi:hypothetical protein